MNVADGLTGQNAIDAAEELREYGQRPARIAGLCICGCPRRAHRGACLGCPCPELIAETAIEGRNVERVWIEMWARGFAARCA